MSPALRGASRRSRLTSLSLCCALATAMAAQGQSPAASPQPPQVPDAPGRPIKTTLAFATVITLHGDTRAVTACGVQITVLRDEQPLVAAALVQRREGEDTSTTWCASPRERLQAKPAQGKAVLDVRGAGRLEAPIALPPAPASASCTTLEAPSPLLFQRLFVTGGTLRIGREGQPTLSVTLPRPLPSDVSRAYLNCAGDLFASENEDS